MINLPLWIPLLGFAGIGLLFLRTLRREPKPGCCSRCGYDLQGIPAHSPCPECAAGSVSFMKRLAGTLRPMTASAHRRPQTT